MISSPSVRLRLYRSSKKEKESGRIVFLPSKKGHFHVVVVQWGQRNVQKARCQCKVVVKPIAFLRPQRGFPNMVLDKTKRIFASIERELHVSFPHEFLS